MHSFVSSVSWTCDGGPTFFFFFFFWGGGGGGGGTFRKMIV
jgi:hypothetical protein